MDGPGGVRLAKLMDLVDTGAVAPFLSTWEEPEDDGKLMRLWSFC